MASIVILGLSVTSSWGNGHATTWRALIKALAARGHSILFLERDVPWYAQHRDLVASADCEVALYTSLADLHDRFAPRVADADAVIVGSFVPEGIAVGEWALAKARGVVAFYDIDTPVTLAALARGECAYLTLPLIARYQLYLSFTGGPVLRQIEAMGSPRAAALYCSVDAALHAPVPSRQRWALGYLGTYSPDRQPAVEELLLKPAGLSPREQFVVAGAQYPVDLVWPGNVTHIAHLPPAEHSGFYCGQRFALNITRGDMMALGYSPSVRLFEAAACGVPVISDAWKGVEDFFAPGEEILLASSHEEILRLLEQIGPEKRDAIGQAARRHVLAAHTAQHRAAELEALLKGGSGSRFQQEQDRSVA